MRHIIQTIRQKTTIEAIKHTGKFQRRLSGTCLTSKSLSKTSTRNFFSKTAPAPRIKSEIRYDRDKRVASGEGHFPADKRPLKTARFIFATLQMFIQAMFRLIVWNFKGAMVFCGSILCLLCAAEWGVLSRVGGFVDGEIWELRIFRAVGPID